jgi:glycosyltransferase involved in cell wall biosynthesis
MKILIIYQHYLGKNKAGMSRFNQLAKYWSQRHQLTVISGQLDRMSGQLIDRRYRGKFLSREQEGKNIRVIRSFVWPGSQKNFLARLRSHLSFLFSSSVAGLFSGPQDIVVASSPPLFVGLTGYLVSRLKRIPFIFEVRDLWPDFAVDAGVLKNKLLIRASFWLEKFLYKKAALINVLTPAFGRVLREEKSVPASKIVFVPNGADLELMSPATKNNWVRKKYGWADKFVVLYLGAHGLANHLDLVLESAGLMRDYPDINFVFVGDGMVKPQLSARALAENLDNVFFLDPVAKEKVADYINAADVCVAVLKKVFQTTYPNKIFDYMACARPIVLAIDGASRQLVVDRAKAGLYADPSSARAFSEAVLAFYRQPRLAARCGENGYQYVKKNFSRRKLALKYEKIMVQLLNRGY